jgi:hypothetical protein
VTTSSYTVDEDFSTADAVFDCIGDAGDERFSLHDLTTPGVVAASDSTNERSRTARHIAHFRHSRRTPVYCRLYTRLHEMPLAEFVA